MASVSTQCQVLDAIQARIVALALVGVDTSRIVVRPHPYLTEEEVKAGDWILICPWGGEANDAGTNAREEWQYPTLIALEGREGVSTLDTWMSRREKIRRNLHHVELAGVSNGTFITQQLRPGLAVDADALRNKKLFVSVLMHYCNVQEGRS